MENKYKDNASRNKNTKRKLVDESDVLHHSEPSSEHEPSKDSFSSKKLCSSKNPNRPPEKAKNEKSASEDSNDSELKMIFSKQRGLNFNKKEDRLINHNTKLYHGSFPTKHSNYADKERFYHKGFVHHDAFFYPGIFLDHYGRRFEPHSFSKINFNPRQYTNRVVNQYKKDALNKNKIPPNDIDLLAHFFKKVKGSQRRVLIPFPNPYYFNKINSQRNKAITSNQDCVFPMNTAYSNENENSPCVKAVHNNTQFLGREITLIKTPECGNESQTDKNVIRAKNRKQNSK